MGPTWSNRLKIRLKQMFGKSLVLCDSCKWDWRSACRNPERPNTIWCQEYEKRGK